MSTTTFIVQIYLDYDFGESVKWTVGARRKGAKRYDVGPEWVRGRIKFFEKYTLKSLLNQYFQDFRIFLICGLKYREITESHCWHSKVELCYDEGRSKYTAIDTDYICITRIDSDDLMHCAAMSEVREKWFPGEKRGYLVWRKNFQWHQTHLLLLDHIRLSPPFFTNIFPKAIYKNWDIFYKQHFVRHRYAGGRKKEFIELSPRKICVIKHPLNVSRLRLGKQMRPMNDGKKASLKKAGFLHESERAKIAIRLEPFGVLPEDV